jgi:carbamoyltransferase
LARESVIVGLTPARTQRGELHIDGSACCVTPDSVCSIAEERITRRKHAGGAEFALRTVLADCGVHLQDVDRFYVSTCGERVPQPDAPVELSEDGTRLTDIGVPPEKISWVSSHHLSHARVALTLSGIERSLVVVMDDAGSAPRAHAGEGPMASRAEISSELERTTIYMSVDGTLRLAHATAAPLPAAGGYGTMYRYITDYIGMNGLTESGKTMALAAYGRSDRFETLPLMVPVGSGHVTTLQGPPDCSKAAVAQLLRQHGQPGAHPTNSPTQHLNDLARRAQDELETSVISLLGRLIEDLDVRDVCLGGGVALNCVLNGRLAAMPEIGSLRVATVPGDTGQSLGNCLLALHEGRLPVPSLGRCAYLGPRYAPARVQRACRAWSHGFEVREGNIAARVASAVADGKVVGIFHGRSELGPRALGHRSILADPRRPTMQDHLNCSVKGREGFRPYGAAILAEYMADLTGRSYDSPAMSLALPLLAKWRARLPAVCHVDGTCRLQTVGSQDCAWMRRVLTAFHAITGVPAILNTSFNAGGKPIIETPEDALAALASMSIDALAIEDFFIEKPGFGRDSGDHDIMSLALSVERSVDTSELA